MAARLVRLLVFGAALVLFPFNASAQNLANGSFEVRSEVRPDHPAEWGVGGQGYEIRLDSTVAFDAGLSLRMKKLDGGGFGVATQSLDAAPFRGQRLTLTGRIRTESVESGYAGLWIRLDATDRDVLYLDNMAGRGATGTSDWAAFSITAAVGDDADRIVLGALMPGSGTAWYDALAIEAVAESALAPASDSAAAYLDRALDLMEARSIRADQIDWPSFRERAHDEARGATSAADVHDVVRGALRRLGDRHSFFMPPASVEAWRNRSADAATQGPGATGELVAGRFGHLTIPGFGAGGEEAGRTFADDIHALISSLDAEGACGWVVDLRENTGGNMWPMLAGLGPVLGEGTAGYFIPPTGEGSPWSYRDGSAINGGQATVTVSTPYSLQRPNPPVAVLTGPSTASSGEAIVVAFRKRPLTRSFGEGTAGLSTANSSVELSDGAMMLLTTSVFADRERSEYGSVIPPDEVVSGADADPLLAAVAWLSAQAACRPPR